MESSTENLFSFESVLSRIAANNRGRDDYLFVCSGPALSPRRIEISRSHPEAIREHKRNCPKCSQIEKERAEESQLRLEGPRRVQYCLIVISKARQDIDYYQRLKIELDQKKERGEELDYKEQQRLKNAEYDSGAGTKTIKRELEELHKLLHHENKTIREGARKEYDKYIERKKQLMNKKIKKGEDGRRARFIARSLPDTNASLVFSY